MINAIFAALNDGTYNMLLALLLITLLIIWLQSRLHKDFKVLREEIADGFEAMRKEIADCQVDLRKDFGKVSDRVARIEGALGLSAPVPDAPPTAQSRLLFCGILKYIISLHRKFHCFYERKRRGPFRSVLRRSPRGNFSAGVQRAA